MHANEYTVRMVNHRGNEVYIHLRGHTILFYSRSPSINRCWWCKRHTVSSKWAVFQRYSTFDNQLQMGLTVKMKFKSLTNEKVWHKVVLVTYCIKNHNYWSNCFKILSRWNFASSTLKFWWFNWTSNASQIKIWFVYSSCFSGILQKRRKCPEVKWSIFQTLWIGFHATSTKHKPLYQANSCGNQCYSLILLTNDMKLDLTPYLKPN